MCCWVLVFVWTVCRGTCVGRKSKHGRVEAGEEWEGGRWPAAAAAAGLQLHLPVLQQQLELGRVEGLAVARGQQTLHLGRILKYSCSL